MSQLLPPPPGSEPPVPRPGSAPAHAERRALNGEGLITAAVAFFLVVVPPSLFFLVAAFSESETATRTAGALAAWLIGFEVAFGLIVAVIVWAIGLIRSASTRRVINGFILVGAALWGFTTGWIGGVLIGIERHPTWDDA